MTAAAHEPEVGPDAALLEAVRASKQAELAEQVRQLKLVVEWCAAHQVDETEATTYVEFGRDTGLALAGPGAPWVSEFAVLELAAALGMTPDACKRYVGQVLEVHHRLGRLWNRVVAGQLPFWRAGRIAQHTMNLAATGAAYVDQHLAGVAHKVGPAQTERLCQEALARYAPAEAEAKRQEAADERRVDVHTRDARVAGTLEITGTADTADGLDFDAALSQVAAELKAAGCTESLDVRRSMALGLIARRQLGLDLNAGRATGREGGPLVKPRQVTINVHLRDQHVGRSDTTRSPITVEQVKGWCTNPDTQVIIRPVVDLNEHIRVDGYEVPDRLADQAAERDGSCVFPHCTRPAPSCDKDHTVPYDQGGETSSDNIACLCRGHHRLKTHTAWSYRFLRPGHYLWRSPTGFWFYRDGTGTVDLGHLTPD